jgi:hypothetical protein
MKLDDIFHKTQTYCREAKITIPLTEADEWNTVATIFPNIQQVEISERDPNYTKVVSLYEYKIEGDKVSIALKERNTINGMYDQGFDEFQDKFEFGASNLDEGKQFRRLTNQKLKQTILATR